MTRLITLFALPAVLIAVLLVALACGTVSEAPTPTPTIAPTPEHIGMSVAEAVAQGYTREEETCANRQQFPDLYSNVPHEELENGMCAFYYPPDDIATTEPTATVAATPTPTDTAQDSDRATLLKEFAQLGGDAFARREWAIVHALYPDEFRAKCSLGEFATMAAFLVAFAGIPEDITYVVESVRVEGDHGYIESRYAKDGLEIDFGEENEADPNALWQDGEWTVYVSPNELAEEKPCSLDSTDE